MNTPHTLEQSITDGRVTYLTDMDSATMPGTIRFLLTHDPEQSSAEKIVTFSGVTTVNTTFHEESNHGQADYLEMLLGIETRSQTCTLITEFRSIEFDFKNWDVRAATGA